MLKHFLYGIAVVVPCNPERHRLLIIACTAIFHFQLENKYIYGYRFRIL